MKSVAEKTSSLIKSIKLSKSSIKFRQLYSFFLEIKNSSIVYWLSQNLLEVISRGITLERQREVVKGISTAANPRFIRFLWETSYLQKRWKVYAKGEGYKKWFGLQIHTFDWEYDGIRLKAYNSELYGGASWTKNLRNLNLFNHSGIVAAKIASGSLGFRISQEHTGFDNAAIFVDIPNEIDSTALLGHLNTRVSTYVVRALNPSIIFEPGYVGKIPLPSNNLLESIIPLAQFCIELSKLESSKSLIEKNFQYNQNFDLYKHQALRHLGEGFLEYQAVQALVLDNVSLKLLIEETGTPAGWFPLIPGYDSLPSSCALEPEIPNKIIELFEISKRCVFTREEISLLKQKLLHLYQAGQGIKSETEIEEEEKEEELIEMLEDEEEVHEEIGAHHSIPNETFIEELSVKLEIHPISVYWLLKEGREREGWRCIPEEKRFIEDQFTVMVLRLLGHRWHKQIEAGELVPDWADQDGVIPISKGTHEPTLGDQVQERIAAEFPNSTVASIAAKFEAIVGISLEKWLSGAFFKRHISQFKKRPIAWQIESSPITSSRSNRANSAFSCLIYYHKLDADLLPKLRSQYVGILRQSYETELRNLEAMSKEQRSTEQVARILQLPNWIEELKTLEDSLYQVSTIGFGLDFLKPRLRQLAIDDATLCLKARWLRKLMQVIQTDPLDTWMDAAIATELHPDFAQWIETAFSHLDHHCSQVGSQPPNAEDLEQDPTASDLAKHICQNDKAMLTQTLNLACSEWWAKFNETLITPLKQQIKEAEAEAKALKEEIAELGTQKADQRRTEITVRLATLKADIKAWKATIKARTAKGDTIRKTIAAWKCPDSETWEPWLATQLIYDQISSLDERRTPPQTIAEFVAQESTYTPDLNDGVRVNIAPLQRAGLLANDVLAAKDVDKAIGDRAEWRADERRWCREGKLPQPGWWKIDTKVDIL